MCHRQLQTRIKPILPTGSGIYQMLDKSGAVLYVGKAKNLKKRVLSYFRADATAKTQALMQHVVDITTIITASETEALLLENTLIKKYKPKYNIIFKDDKTYPYIHVSEHEFPRLSIQRETKKIKGKYYGPYPSGYAAREAISELYKIFLLRQCRDAFFRNRTRPCVQYQIKRCSAPCVNLISKADYKISVEMVDKLLKGDVANIFKEIKAKMQEAAEKLDFEMAAKYRDKSQALEKICQHQYVCGKDGNIDVIAFAKQQKTAVIQILFVRNGKVVGTKAYFPIMQNDSLQQDVVEAFLAQYYLNELHKQTAPESVIININLETLSWLERVISSEVGHKVGILTNVRGNNRKLLDMAKTNAYQSLQVYLAKQQNIANALQELQTIFKLKRVPKSLECFDISHSMGEATIASCVVFDQNGPVKSSYRRFNITGIQKGDDFAAMEQALIIRYQHNEVPDVVIVDGGKGQLTRAKKILGHRNSDILAIAKGVTRKPGLEVIHATSISDAISLDDTSPVLHLLQRIRDEAHRFAITGHRKKLTKAKLISILENIPGIGSQKRKELLQYFGGIREIASAKLEEIAKVPGINTVLAKRIYDSLHADENRQILK